MNLPTPRRLTVALIIVSILVFAFVITGCSQLSAKESTVDRKFLAMVPELSLRYSRLNDSVIIAETVGGERDITIDAKVALKKFDKAKKERNTSDQLKAARELETIIGRLRANAQSSPKLSGSAELKTNIEELDKLVPASSVLGEYKNSVENYEDARNSWRLLLSSIVGGFSAPKQLEFSKPVK